MREQLTDDRRESGQTRPRTTKRRAETRARLLDAAFAVFADRGYGQVSIEQVCSTAGYTRGAFYSQFASLEELFFTLYDQRAQIISDQVQQTLESLRDPADIGGLIDAAAAVLLLDRDWLLIKTDFLTHVARRPELASRLISHRAQLRVAIETKLDAAEITIPPAVGTAADAANAVVAVYDGVTVQLLLDHDVAGARQWLAELLAAYFNLRPRS